MSKAIGRILVLIVAGMLMLYSASRTYNLLAHTMPPGQEIVAFIALAAFDVGLIAWLIIFLRGAEGGLQRGIALFMIVIDLAGVIIGFIGDTLYSSGETGLLAAMGQGDRQTIVLLTASVIAINIAGAVFFHMADPDNLKRMATENARDQIEKQALDAIKQQAALLAAELAPAIASDWVVQMRAQFTGSLADQSGQNLLTAPQDQPPKPSITARLKAAIGGQPAAAPVQTMAVDSPDPIEVIEEDEQPAPKGKKKAR